ncbi:putative uncharacterized transposon-derived protein F54H12.3 [Halotydeus destructor]|nr:putative uncharacterized transposon-derived protein F54H12.3 [Halotydeus destructor]
MARNKEVKAAVVERVNRTIKSKLYRIMTMRGTKTYIDCLPAVVKTYNNTRHRSIGMAPAQVTLANTATVFRNLYGVDSYSDLYSQRENTLRKGDTVLVGVPTTAFTRGFSANWSPEVKNVAVVNRTDVPQYKLQGSRKRHYPAEVQPVNNKYRQVEKVIKRRGNEQLVKWKYEPRTRNSWINV